MRFCRSCYAVLADDEAICKACKTRQPERKPAGKSVLEEPTQRPRFSQLSAPEEKPATQSIADTHSDEIRVRRVTYATTNVHKGNWKILQIIMLTALIVFASYILWQHAVNTEVTTDISRQTLDETFRMLILSELRAHPTEYYQIADRFFRQVFTSQGPIFTNDFPLIFYIWLLAPNIQDIKWLYFVFALAGTVASYFAIFVATKQWLVAVLSAVWVAYFLETPSYLDYEPWAVSVFLIGLALFFMNQHVPAAITIGVSTLFYEVFAPFLLFASICYLVVSRQDWLHIVRIGESRIMRPLTRHVKTKEAFVWITATFVVGLLWYLNGLVSTGGNPDLTHAGFQRALGFNPELALLLFSGSSFLNPLRIGNFGGFVPIVLLLVVVVVGMTFLDQDKCIIMYASFAFIPFLIPFGIVRVGAIASISNVAERWAVMSITMVNLFWLTGLYRICEYPYRLMQHSLPLRMR